MKVKGENNIGQDTGIIKISVLWLIGHSESLRTWSGSRQSSCLKHVISERHHVHDLSSTAFVTSQFDG